VEAQTDEDYAYALKEYGLTKEELDRSYGKTLQDIKEERAAGKLKEFDL
jgi:hypothetical protein